MLERTEKIFGLKPKRLVADTAYGTGKFLGWLIGAGITPHIPVWDKSTREDGTFSRADFTFDKERNVYVCPAGKLLTTTGSVGPDHVLRYRASKRDCQVCSLKPQCCPKTPSRKVQRDINEDARDHARALMGTPEFIKSRDERKKVEMRFAHLKTHHRFERMRLRASPAHATSSISPPSCKTSKRWQTTSGGRLMPRLLALRECQLPQKQIDRVNGEPLEGARAINKTGDPRLKLK